MMLFLYQLALQMLVLQCMTLTLDDIATHRTRLHQEIMERECLLAAFDVVEKYAASGHAPRSMELGSLVSGLLPSRAAIEVKELPVSAATPAPASIPPPAPAALPPKPLPERYMHPELKAIPTNMHGRNSQAVSWAIQRMTDDYSLRDIHALLKREGFHIEPAQISVVLTRMKVRGEIEEIKFGYGPSPALFRKPEAAMPAETDSAEPEGAALSIV